MVRSIFKKPRRKNSVRKTNLTHIEDECDEKQKDTPLVTLHKRTEMNREIKNTQNKDKLSGVVEFDKYHIDVEAFLRGEKSKIEEITDINDLYEAKEAYKKTVKRILDAKKKEMLNDAKMQRLELLNCVPDDVKRMPFICLLIGLRNNYVGEKIISKRKIDALKKKPSIIVKIEDQTITIDGSDVKVVGKGHKAYNNKFINEIKNLYDNYYGGGRRK